jgi:hypothetical protein
MYQARTLP